MMQRIRGLDGLRGIAAVMVYAYHAWGRSGFPVIQLRIFDGLSFSVSQLFNFGGHGVSLFFVLSGFLLSIPFWQSLLGGPKVDVGKYLQRRFLRIYPAYFVVVLVLALVYDTGHPLAIRAVHVLSHLGLIHNFAENTIYNISGPLWSVATEFQLYLLLPLIFLGLALASRKGVPLRLAALLLALIGGAVGIVFWSAGNAVVGRLALDPGLIKVNGLVLFHSPLVGLAHFSAGIGAGLLYLKGRDRVSQLSAGARVAAGLVGYTLLVSLPMLVVGHGVGFLRWPPVGWPLVSLSFAGLVLMTGLGSTRWGLTELLERRPLRLLGTASYSFYLWHDAVLWAVYDRLPAGIHPWLDHNAVRALLGLLLTIVIAWASYQLLEKRFGGLVAGLFQRREAFVLAKQRGEA